MIIIRMSSSVIIIDTLYNCDIITDIVTSNKESIMSQDNKNKLLRAVNKIRLVETDKHDIETLING